MQINNSTFRTPHPAYSETAPAGPWRGVFFDGPQPSQNADGDEIPVWLVYEGDADAEPVDTVYTCRSFLTADSLARRMAQDRRLELIHEAATA